MAMKKQNKSFQPVAKKPVVTLKKITFSGVKQIRRRLP
jgi:hypothetical protein|tara:strand:+ start:10209 stop:10322 length:114 start_codon:yes stop_codon:yes gene_type:complete